MTTGNRLRRFKQRSSSTFPSCRRLGPDQAPNLSGFLRVLVERLGAGDAGDDVDGL